MNKQEAAEFLGVSVRAIERYMQQNKISARYERGKTRSVAVYDEEELRAFKDELAAPLHKPTVENGTSPNVANGQTALAIYDGDSNLPSAPGSFGNFIQALSVLDERMLTVEEAAEFSGISEGALRRGMKAGQLPKYKGYGRGDRLKKSELRAYLQNIQPDR